MRKALVTCAVGPHLELLAIALPSFEAFAARHGYDLVLPEMECRRPPSWWKVPALKAALEGGYDLALWLDADTVIVDPTEDMAVPAKFWQAMVCHQTGDGGVPNCGVWMVRQPMIPYLEQAWEKTEFLNHGWWEQAAMHSLMGFEGRPVELADDPPELYEKTLFLDPGWNCHIWDKQPITRRRIEHATMIQDRAAAMRQWADQARAAAAPPPAYETATMPGREGRR